MLHAVAVTVAVAPVAEAPAAEAPAAEQGYEAFERHLAAAQQANNDAQGLESDDPALLTTVERFVHRVHDAYEALPAQERGGAQGEYVVEWVAEVLLGPDLEVPLATARAEAALAWASIVSTAASLCEQHRANLGSAAIPPSLDESIRALRRTELALRSRGDTGVEPPQPALLGIPEPQSESPPPQPKVQPPQPPPHRPHWQPFHLAMTIGGATSAALGGALIAASAGVRSATGDIEGNVGDTVEDHDAYFARQDRKSSTLLVVGLVTGAVGVTALVTGAVLHSRATRVRATAGGIALRF